MCAGTENVPGIIWLGEAFKLSELNLEKSGEQISKIQNHFKKQILEEIHGIQLTAVKIQGYIHIQMFLLMGLKARHY